MKLDVGPTSTLTFRVEFCEGDVGSFPCALHLFVFMLSLLYCLFLKSSFLCLCFCLSACVCLSVYLSVSLSWSRGLLPREPGIPNRLSLFSIDLVFRFGRCQESSFSIMMRTISGFVYHDDVASFSTMLLGFFFSLEGYCLCFVKDDYYRCDR